MSKMVYCSSTVQTVKKNYEKEFNEAVARRFESNYRLCDKDINKFRLILRKGVYLYEYIDSCQIFNETSLPDKKEFYRNLNMEDMLTTKMQKTYGKILKQKI